MSLPLAPRGVGRVGVCAWLAWSGVGLLTATAGWAQQFTARTELVEVYATVTDDKGRFVTDLSRAEFVILEDGVAQSVHTFADGEQPVSVALAVDRSWSMANGRLDAARKAGSMLLRELGEQDRAMLVAIGSDVDVPVALTSNHSAVEAALQTLDPWGATALYDAVVTAFDAIETAPGRRALVLISDGLERGSRKTADDVLARVRASDVLAYPVVLQRKVPVLLERLAATTGGRAIQVKRLEDLSTVLRRIAADLRYQYLIGYQPLSATRPGEYRRIEVRVTRPGHLVRARAGYLAR